MGSALEIFGFELYNEIKSIINKNSNSYKKEIIDALIPYFISDKFFAFGGGYKNDFLLLIIEMCEMNENLLFLKILFPLLEELKNKNFENQLKKLEKFKKKDFESFTSIYFGCEYFEKINNTGNNWDKFENDLKILDKTYILEYKTFIEIIINMAFGLKKFLKKNESEKKYLFIEELRNCSYFLRKIINEKSMIINEISKLEPLNHTEEFYQFIISSFYASINVEKI